MHHFELLEILAIGLLAALVLGFVTHRLKLSPIVGYLLAGYLVGPHSPGYVADAALAGQLAEVGVILLMFGVGLHFDTKDLWAVKNIAIPGAVAQSLVATLVGVGVALASGLTLSAGLVLGLGLAVASTVVLIRVLTDNEMLDTVPGHVAVGWLIVEDIFTVLVLVVLPALAAGFKGAAGVGVNLLPSLGLTFLKLVALWALIFPVGGRVVPWLLAQVARARSRELFTLAILVLAFVIATGASMIFGVSVALGAFLAGMVTGKTTLSHQAAADLLPMRDAFAVLFFISIGMLFDPAFLVLRPGLVLACLAIILFVKPLVAALVVVALGYSMRTTLTVALGLAQIGEFSFILAQQAMGLMLMPQEGFSVLVACALISITLNPLIFRLIGPMEDWLRRRKWLWELLNRRAMLKGKGASAQTEAVLSQQAPPASRAIVLGYGPVGRELTSLLKEYNLSPVVIDLNVDTVNELVAQGHAAVFGDGGHRSILKSAGIEKAEYLLITLPDLNSALAAITSARNLNPAIKILVRARFLYAQSILDGLGVMAISFEEEAVARAMATALLDNLNPSRKEQA